jgi:peptidoglycan/xylan/chitin deacetylase (PgdA/CDA1 family)
MYHYISYLPPDADDIRVGLTVTPDRFAGQMQYLAENGYQTISLYEMEDALLYGDVLPPRPVILTFDDGHLDHHQNVLPILVQHNFTATFFIITEFADQQADGYMNWQQIEELANAGMSIEAHTKTHPDLRNRTQEFLVYQIIGSTESIHAHTGSMPAMFAYPAGRYDTNTLNFLDSTQILRALTTMPGIQHTTDNRFEVTRLRISQDIGSIGLASLLNQPQQ